MEKIKNLFASVARRGKAFAYALAFVFGVGSAFAEDGGNSINLGAATTALTDAQSALSTWVNANTPTLVKILGAFLVVTLIFVVYGWIRRASKGR